MENRKTKTFADEFDADSFAGFGGGDEITKQRLDILLTINAETARENVLFRTDEEKYQASLMSNPLDAKQSYAYFGLILGALTPAAMFTRFLIDLRIWQREDFWILGILFIVNIITAIVGYFSGKAVGKIISEFESYSWLAMICLLPFIGLIWGITTGGAGGIIIFIFGAIFGAILGGVVGCIALPAFTIFRRMLKSGDFIDRKHFLPLAFGITFIICGFILGL